MSKSERIIYKNIPYYRYPKSALAERRYYFRSFLGKTLHRVLWEEINGPIPKGFHVHHKDGDPTNNKIENLECLTPKDHFKAHKKLAENEPSKDIYAKVKLYHRSDRAKTRKLPWTVRKKEQLKCLKCGCDYEKHIICVRRFTFLCDRCRIKRYNPSRVTPTLKNCEICQKTIVQKTSRQKRFCSKACKSKSRLKSKIDNESRLCLICKQEFDINKYAPTVTCSFMCRNKYIQDKSLGLR